MFSNRYLSHSQLGMIVTSDLADPTAEKARLALTLAGPSISTALFRAELKKELVFFRGCRAYFTPVSSDKSNLICEGKTVQIVKFLDWLNTLALEVNQRKQNFQGPNLVAQIISMSWEEYKGDLAPGFVSNSTPPSLDPNRGEADPWTEAIIDQTDGAQIEAKSMTGTDESV